VVDVDVRVTVLVTVTVEVTVDVVVLVLVVVVVVYVSVEVEVPVFVVVVIVVVGVVVQVDVEVEVLVVSAGSSPRQQKSEQHVFATKEPRPKHPSSFKILSQSQVWPHFLEASEASTKLRRASVVVVEAFAPKICGVDSTVVLFETKASGRGGLSLKCSNFVLSSESLLLVEWSRTTTLVGVGLGGPRVVAFLDT